jgi:hypothetical protein
MGTSKFVFTRFLFTGLAHKIALQKIRLQNYSSPKDGKIRALFA